MSFHIISTIVVLEWLRHQRTLVVNTSTNDHVRGPQDDGGIGSVDAEGFINVRGRWTKASMR
jgi:hypothetical protein